MFFYPVTVSRVSQFTNMNAFLLLLCILNLRCHLEKSTWEVCPAHTIHISHLYNYFEAQNISGCNRRNLRQRLPSHCGTSFLWWQADLSWGRWFISSDFISKDALYKGEVIIFLRANMSDVSFSLVLVKWHRTLNWELISLVRFGCLPTSLGKQANYLYFLVIGL